jgi:peptidoglycan/xylan/chitin deacetylase (PgdA/CDA1 family)
MFPWLAATGGCAASGLFAWSAYHPASTLFGRTIRHAPSDRAVALTFDDGPNPAVTPRLLDLLDRHRAHGTFFLIGRWARAYPSIVRDIARRGHTIGNHTTTHPNLIPLPTSRIVGELVECQTILEEIAGVRPSLVRPPFGARGPHFQMAVRRSGLTHVVTWTLMGRDWTGRGQQRLESRLQRVKGGDVVVLHDGSFDAIGADRHATVRALEYWLPRWIDAGLELQALPG